MFQPVTFSLKLQGEKLCRFCVSNGNPDEDVQFSLARSDLKKFDDEYLQQLNGWLQQKSPEQQQAIYETYKEIRNTFVNFHTALSDQQTYQINRQLEPMVDRLLTLWNGDIEHYLMFQSKIFIPETFRSVFIEDLDRIITREQTYIRQDYIDLISFAFLIRCLMPVLIEYISIIQRNTGNEHKELVACLLLMQTSIYQNHPAVHKLERYIEVVLAKKPMTPKSILSGMSSHDFPQIVLSSCIIKRIFTENLMGHSKSTLVSILAKYIEQRINPQQNQASAPDVRKHNGANDSGNESILESFNATIDISPGDTCLVDTILTDPYRALSQLDPTIPPDLLALIYHQSYSSLMLHTSTPTQITLVRWVMHTVIPPRGIEHLSRVSLVKALGLTAAYLFHRKMPSLANLVLSTPIEPVEGTYHFSPSIPNRFNRDLREMTAIIDEQYPLRLKTGSLKKARYENVVLSDIEAFLTEARTSAWGSHAPVKYLGDQGRFFTIDEGHRYDLHKLCAELGLGRPLPQYEWAPSAAYY